MKALALDCAVSRLVIAAKNDDKVCMTVYDIGMKQSETIVPAIEYALSKVGTTASELDYMAITQGPGSFTGLRLGFSALKAIECAFNIPIYGISTLEAYAYPFLCFNLPVISGIDARKERFYAGVFSTKEKLLEENDYPLEEIYKFLENTKELIVTGPDSKVLNDLLAEKCPQLKLFCPPFQPSSAETLFEIAEKNIADKIPPMKDFDGPVYLRASEAELVKEAQNSKNN